MLNQINVIMESDQKRILFNFTLHNKFFVYIYNLENKYMIVLANSVIVFRGMIRDLEKIK